MATERELPGANPADVAEQQVDVDPPDDRVGLDADELPLEADEADVADQRAQVPDREDDDEL